MASLIPQDLKNFLQEIEALGFSLCLVGGAPRDYLLNNILSHDLDFEVRNLDIGKLLKFLKSKGLAFTELPYQIIRVDFNGYDLEFSLPRIENPVIENKSHHHFEAFLDEKLSYAEAFKRRDFTINAIGVEFSTGKIIDPYMGESDLKQKILREISDYFFQDSVRFLRLIRFQIKYGFSISENLVLKLRQFDLRELSIHHFKEEMKKSGRPGVFINRFNELVKIHQIPLSVDFSFWDKFKFSENAQSADDLLVSAFLEDKDLAREVSGFFLMPEKRLKDLRSFSDSFSAVEKLTKNDLIQFSARPLDKKSDLTILKDLKNLEEKKEWKKYFLKPLVISWSDWENIVVEKSLLESTEVTLRSYLRFYLAVKKVVQL